MADFVKCEHCGCDGTSEEFRRRLHEHVDQVVGAGSARSTLAPTSRAEYVGWILGHDRRVELDAEKARALKAAVAAEMAKYDAPDSKE